MLFRSNHPMTTDGEPSWLRWFVFGYLVLWGGFLVFLYVSWNEFALWQKMLFGLIELLLTPDVSDLKFAVTGKSNIYKTK